MRATARNYADLVVWQRAVDLTLATYALTAVWPREEVFGLTAQIRRSAVSIATNIAEGQGRRSDREFQRFLNISHGSLRELETCVVISERLEYGSADKRSEVMQLAGEVGRPPERALQGFDSIGRQTAGSFELLPAACCQPPAAN